MRCLRLEKASAIFAITFLSGKSNAEGETDDEDGLGSAQMIAFAVCGLIVLAFIMVCYIMIRNA